MRKIKKITAAMLAGILTLQGFASIPVAQAVETEAAAYEGLIGYVEPDSTEPKDENAVAKENGASEWIIPADYNYAGTEISSLNATEFRKKLEIKDSSMIPAAQFSFFVEAAEEDIPAEYDEDGKLIKLPVLKGVGADKIVYKLKNVVDNEDPVADGFGDDAGDYLEATRDNGLVVEVEDDEDDPYSIFTIFYAPQAVVLPDNPAKGGDSFLPADDDNVLLDNLFIEDGIDKEVDTYYAIKAVQLDFTNCGFTEPGIYRYYITEGVDENNYTLGVFYGIDNDTMVRTLDVYVDDATYYEKNGDEQGDKIYDLKISGYVLYNDYVEEGPAASENKDEAVVADVEKTDGIVNGFDTASITIEKEVQGNQGSNDQFFKFNISLKPDSSIETEEYYPDDLYVLKISEDSTFVVDPQWADAGEDETPNRATVYSKVDIYTANACHEETDDQDELLYRYITFGEIKEHGYDFYLQAGQKVIIEGVPCGMGYEIWEYCKDYDPEVELKGVNDGYDNLNEYYEWMDEYEEDGDGNPVYPEVEAVLDEYTDYDTDVDERAIGISDICIAGDVYATFTNTKNGTIPTGIIMHVFPVAVLAVSLTGAVIFFAVRRREDEEE